MSVPNNDAVTPELARGKEETWVEWVRVLGECGAYCTRGCMMMVLAWPSWQVRSVEREKGEYYVCMFMVGVDHLCVVWRVVWCGFAMICVGGRWACCSNGGTCIWRPGRMDQMVWCELWGGGGLCWGALKNGARSG